jgi:hypothetical protein
MHDKLELIMSIHQPIIIDGDPMPTPTGKRPTTLPHKKGGLIKKASKPTKTAKKTVKKAVKKSKKS